MTVMVDESLRYPGKGWWCHMTTDGPIEELHEFACHMGLNRRYFHNHPRHPHYDLTRPKRKLASAAGAVFVPAVDQAILRMRRQGRLPTKGTI